jgi:proteasome lid subunit RPN8/RPN11
VEASWPLARLVALAEDSPAAEICGLLVRRGEAEAEAEPWPIANVSATPATAFELAPGEVLGALRRMDVTGMRLVGVYHSHLAGGAALSTRDLAGALAEGRPVLPGVVQLVVALEGGQARLIRVHRWCGHGFSPTDLWWR